MDNNKTFLTSCNGPIVDFDIGNRIWPIYLDTGANVNAIHVTHAIKLVESGYAEVYKQKAYIFNANQSRFCTEYKIDTILKFGDVAKMATFLVLTNPMVPCPILIGHPIMHELGITIDLKNKVVSGINVSKSYVQSNTSILKEHFETSAITIDNIKIPALQSAFIKCRINNEANGAMIVNSLTNITKNKGVSTLNNVLIPIIDNTCFITVDNNSPSEIIIPNGHPIVNVTICDQQCVPEEQLFLHALRDIGLLPQEQRDQQKKIQNLEQRVPLEKHKFNIISKIDSEITNKLYQTKLSEILLDNQAAFARDERDLGCLKGAEHIIDTTDEVPVTRRPYPVPHSKIKLVDEEIGKLLDAEIISPSTSAYAAPCLVVLKKNGKPRLVIDYRELNKKIIPVSYPVPNLDTCLQVLGGNKIFSSLDLQSGYHQIPVRLQDRHKLGFSTGRGLFQFNRTPFGLMSSAAAMQRAIERALAGLNNTICLVYVDDIIVTGKDYDDHIENLNTVLKRLIECGFKVNLSKCNFMQLSIKCLGHILSESGIQPDPDKVEAIVNKKMPSNRKELKSFLGLIGYYRKFISDFAGIAEPLNHLLRKGVRFKWTEECNQAVSKFKEKITQEITLKHPNFSETFRITTDASHQKIGAVLSQKINDVDRPIAFYSRSLTEAETRYSTFELEALAIKSALQKWRYFVLGYKIEVYSDCLPAIHILRSKNSTGRIAKYIPIVQEYDITYHYLPGTNNKVSDYLSRQSEEEDSEQEEDVHEEIQEKEKQENQHLHIAAIRQNFQPWTLEELRREQLEDSRLSTIYRNLKDETASPFLLDNYYLYHDVLYQVNLKDRAGIGKLCVPKSLIAKAIELVHVNQACHDGIKRCIQRASTIFTWPGLTKDIKDFIDSCKLCKTLKPSHIPKVLLRAYPEVTAPFQRVCMDLIGPLPRTKNNKTFILVMVDVFTHYTELCPLANKSASAVAKAIVGQLINRHGCVETILTDQGKEFQNAILTEICKNLKINKLNISAYHPSANGLVERMNLQVGNALRAITEGYPQDWDQFLTHVQMALNTAIHGSVGDSPHFLLYGRDPKIAMNLLFGLPNQPEDIEQVEDKLIRMKVAYHVVRQTLKEAFQNYSKRYNQNKKDRSLAIGDLVFRRGKLPIGPNRKFKQRFVGPYRIINKGTNGVTYTLKNISTHKKYRVHVDNIRLAHQHKGNYHPYPIIDNDEDDDLQEANDSDNDEDDPQSIINSSISSEDES